MLELSNWCTLPTPLGDFRMYDSGDDGVRIITMGDIKKLGDEPLVRVHSSCLASEVFHAQDCDCADQLMEAMKSISIEGNGLVIHLHQEGRGQGLSKKIEAVRLMETDDFDTVQSFNHLGLEQDVRTYEPAVKLLKKLGKNSIRLMSNNPRKRRFLEDNGINVKSLSTHPKVRPENEAYLHSKNQKLSHSIPLDEIIDTGEEIRFYHSDQTWGDFSNFSKHSIYLNGLIWETVEHYYQAQKFSNTEIEDKIRESRTPTAAKQIAQKFSQLRRLDWDSVKEKVMLEALQAKFAQHPRLRDLLKRTGDRRIVENSPTDSYWGETEDGNGLNRLGVLLMRVRSEL